MKTVKKYIIFSLVLFCVHSIIFLIVGLFTENKSASIQYGPISSLIYLFIFSYWIYVLASITYLYASKKYKSTLSKLILSAVLMLLGYLFSRTGDIIDGDFTHNFKLGIFIFFIALSPSFVLVERIMKRLFTHYYE